MLKQEYLPQMRKGDEMVSKIKIGAQEVALNLTDIKELNRFERAYTKALSSIEKISEEMEEVNKLNPNTEAKWINKRGIKLLKRYGKAVRDLVVRVWGSDLKVCKEVYKLTPLQLMDLFVEIVKVAKEQKDAWESELTAFLEKAYDIGKAKRNS